MDGLIHKIKMAQINGVFELSQNALTDTDILALVSSIENTHVRDIKIHSWGMIAHENANVLPLLTALAQVDTLESLDIDNVILSGVGRGNALAEVVRRNPGLRRLKLCSTYLSESGLMKLSISLHRHNIQMFEIKQTEAYHTGVKDLFAALATCPSLESVVVEMYYMRTSEHVLAIAEFVAKTRSLTSLIVDVTSWGWYIEDNVIILEHHAIIERAVERSIAVTELALKKPHLIVGQMTYEYSESGLRAEYNQKMMAFVSGCIGNSHIAKFLRRDGDTALGHRILYYLLDMEGAGVVD